MEPVSSEANWPLGQEILLMVSGLRFSLGQVCRQRLEVSPGDVASKNVHEILLEVTFGLNVAQPDGHRPDPVRTQLLSQPDISDLFALAHLHPGPARRSGIEALEKSTREHAIDFREREQDENVQQQRANGIALLGAAA